MENGFNLKSAFEFNDGQSLSDKLSNCGKGILKINYEKKRNYSIVQLVAKNSPQHSSRALKSLLKAYPIAVAMRIPDCNSGVLQNFRGGVGGVRENCDKDLRKCSNHMLNFRRCNQSKLM
jgi:hypothetical protein